jgi:hypothetical protein
MSKFIGFLFLFGLIIYIFTLGLKTLRMFLSSIFGGSPAPPRNTSSNQQKTRQTNAKPTKKIITPDEGEYIDFEEIKE